MIRMVEHHAPRRLPQQLTLYVNYACNLRCRHCYLYGVAGVEHPHMDSMKAGAMTWEVFRRAVDPLIEDGSPFTVFLMGGEPCLHPRLPDMVAYLKRAPRIYVDMNTNGMYLRRKADSLLAAGIDAIYVSLDGSSAAMNDAVRGAGSHAAIVEGIIHLKRRIAAHGAACKTAINYTITNSNYSDLWDMARLAAELGVNELFFNLPSFVSRAEGEAAQRLLAQHGSIEFRSWRGLDIGSEVEGIPRDELLEAIRRLRSAPWPFLLFLQPVGYGPEELASYFDPSWNGIVRQRTCPVLNFRSTVLPNGNVTPCTIYPDIIVGNVTDETLAEIWHGRRYEEFRSLIRRSLLPTCMRCCDLFDETGNDPQAFLSGSRTDAAILPA